MADRAFKLVTRAEHQTASRVVEKLREVATEIEEGKLAGVRMVAMVVEVETPDGLTSYSLRTSGMSNATALWLFEQGKKMVLGED